MIGKICGVAVACIPASIMVFLFGTVGAIVEPLVAKVLMPELSREVASVIWCAYWIGIGTIPASQMLCVAWQEGWPCSAKT